MTCFPQRACSHALHEGESGRVLDHTSSMRYAGPRRFYMYAGRINLWIKIKIQINVRARKGNRPTDMRCGAAAAHQVLRRSCECCKARSRLFILSTSQNGDSSVSTYLRYFERIVGGGCRPPPESVSTVSNTGKHKGTQASVPPLNEVRKNHMRTGDEQLAKLLATWSSSRKARFRGNVSGVSTLHQPARSRLCATGASVLKHLQSALRARLSAVRVNWKALRACAGF